MRNLPPALEVNALFVDRAHPRAGGGPTPAWGLLTLHPEADPHIDHSEPAAVRAELGAFVLTITLVNDNRLDVDVALARHDPGRITLTHEGGEVGHRSTLAFQRSE